ncbi:MAG: B12-binding domain-containing radical SAM protein [Thermoplasmata archaeon]
MVTSGLRDGGVPIVLTAPRSEISTYSGDPFTAFVAVFPRKLIPALVVKDEWLEAKNNDDGTAKFLPYGLRKVESLLIDEFGEENVASVHPDKLQEFVGPNTKAVGISTMDAMGLAYVSMTYNSILGIGGESLDAYEFEQLMRTPCLSQYRPKVIVGGAGSWQVRDAGRLDQLAVDTLVHGEGENVVLELFRKAVEGDPLPKEVYGKTVKTQDIPLIKRAASYGVVEITRGCGRGCYFCSPTNRVRNSLPLDHIMKEVEVNIRGGANSIFTATEDMFIYQCGPKFVPNREAVVKLYRSVADYPGVDYIHLSHASLAPAVRDPKMVEELTPILEGKTMYTPKLRRGYSRKFVTVLFGIESGSIRIMEKYMRGKALPYDVKDWHEIVTQGIGVFNDNGWRPMGTIITGWPGETEDDTIETLELLDKLKDADMFYVPLLFIPLQDSKLRDARMMPLESLTEAQLDFIATCWKYNINCWDKRFQPIYSVASLLSYYLFFRWKHGKKFKLPALRIAGLHPGVYAREYRGCDRRVCTEPQAPRISS